MSVGADTYPIVGRVQSVRAGYRVRMTPFDMATDLGEIVLSIDTGAAHLQDYLTRGEARALGLVLMRAADGKADL